MPKIIENVREQLLSEAKKQITEQGYAKTTIRSVAGSCGLGVGTVYNYFKSKDMLIATFMAEDWLKGVDEIRSYSANEPRELLLSVYNMLSRFIEAHRMLFSDSDATKVFYTVFAERHKMLRDQIADLILPIYRNVADPEFRSQFVAEALLTWTTAGKSFDEIYSIIEKLIK